MICCDNVVDVAFLIYKLMIFFNIQKQTRGCIIHMWYILARIWGKLIHKKICFVLKQILGIESS